MHRLIERRKREEGDLQDDRTQIGLIGQIFLICFQSIIRIIRQIRIIRNEDNPINPVILQSLGNSPSSGHRNFLQ